jgi:hypothetical protein
MFEICFQLVYFVAQYSGEMQFYNAISPWQLFGKSYRLHFEHDQFDFPAFNLELIDKSFGSERIAAFDPSFLNEVRQRNIWFGLFL